MDKKRRAVINQLNIDIYCAERDMEYTVQEIDECECLLKQAITNSDTTKIKKLKADILYKEKGIEYLMDMSVYGKKLLRIAENGDLEMKKAKHLNSRSTYYNIMEEN